MKMWFQMLIAVIGYLLGMAFAGSFLGRKWMGTVDIFLHKILRREVTTGKYLYWKHFCGIANPPKCDKMKNPKNLLDKFIARLI